MLLLCVTTPQHTIHTPRLPPSLSLPTPTPSEEAKVPTVVLGGHIKLTKEARGNLRDFYVSTVAGELHTRPT